MREGRDNNVVTECNATSLREQHAVTIIESALYMVSK